MSNKRRNVAQRLSCDGCPARSRDLRTVRVNDKTLALCPKCIEVIKKLNAAASNGN